MTALLTGRSGEIEDLWSAMSKAYDPRHGRLSRMQQARKLERGLHSPFILEIPELQSGRSLAEETHNGEQQLACIDEEPEQSVLNVRPAQAKATTKVGRRATRPLKKSSDGAPCPSFPAGITRKIASTFARSLGSRSTIIDKETLEAITEATDQYFKQLSEDLGVFADHAGRKNIDESDVVAVMRR